ncbi:MAG: TonB-dependent receptor [Sphingobacteriales bacterium]|nr:TonB-dependent receptor [Sphingobacteriales bacterium]OJY91135.1 MAG: TonB-dependent receptor [Sphingobacteriales bacterium 44-15]
MISRGKYFAIVIALLLLHRGSIAQTENIVTETFRVAGNCEICKARIERSTFTIKAVNKAEWDIKTNQLTVQFDSASTSKSAIQQRIAEAGHDNELFKASDEIYQTLPSCCHYQRIKGGDERQILHSLSGVILEETVKGKIYPVAGATIKNLHSGGYFVTDSTGVFHIQSTLPVPLAVSYTGFQPDTITVANTDLLTITLKNTGSGDLKAITITSKRTPAYISSRSAYNVLHLGAAELSKAACCNLSESFETSPSVDVSYTDAVTGIKQIQLLGLSGIYTQLLTENVPELKGLPGSYGLTFIPGPWIESIQITKGTGSVANGYESITGQINVEEKKPDSPEKLLVNTYANSMGRVEGNINLSQKINEKWSTALLTHSDAVLIRHDANHDGFIDMPSGRQFNVINRWKYMNTDGWVGQFAVKVLNDKRYAGQRDAHHSTIDGATHHYNVDMATEQYTLTGKLGYVFPGHKYKSLGLIFSGNIFNNQSVYGLSEYTGRQKNFYANFIYQSIIGTTAHKYRAGLSLSNEHYNEIYTADHSSHIDGTGDHDHGQDGTDTSAVTKVFARGEIISGAFVEYTYTAPEKLSVIAGARADYHNYFGWIFTPRLNVKYDFTAQTNLRLSVGSGYRLANIFAENAAAFVSSRQFQILNPSNSYGYGLDPERAWTMGINFLHSFKLSRRSGILSIDAYRTNFVNQTVVDLDANPQKISFYNLDGKSYSHNIQVELNYELLKKLDIRIAYRWLDAKTDYYGRMREKPLISKHRAFVNLAYKIADKWKFDYTVQWFGKKRIPYTGSNPEDLQLPGYSPAYIQMAAQVTRKLGERWEIYTGGENLTGYRQSNPILDAQNPFSRYFDASLVWGPVTGRMIYAGARFIL